MLEFVWDAIEHFDYDEEGMSFNFEYNREGRKSRWVKIFTSYVSTEYLLSDSCNIWISNMIINTTINCMQVIYRYFNKTIDLQPFTLSQK